MLAMTAVAGSRYQCKREVKSFWYPTWLAQLAALVPGSKLVDAPARGLSVDDVLKDAKDYEFLVLYTSTPSFANDTKVAELFKEQNPNLLIGFCGAHVAINNEATIAGLAGNRFLSATLNSTLPFRKLLKAKHWKTSSASLS